jgi:hypothetical protein
MPFFIAKTFIMVNYTKANNIPPLSGACCCYSILKSTLLKYLFHAIGFFVPRALGFHQQYANCLSQTPDTKKAAYPTLGKSALTLFAAVFLFAFSAFAQSETTVCGYKVTTAVAYNSPVAGQTTFTFTVQNTNPGNGDNGTYQDLSNFSIVLNPCVDPSKIDKAYPYGSYEENPSIKECYTGNVLKFDAGTSGSTPTVYTLVLNGNYSIESSPNTLAVFKSGEAQPCCSGKIYGITCCKFEVKCPYDKDLGTYDCKTLGNIPAIPTTVATAEATPYNIEIGDNPCGTIRVNGSDDKKPDVCSEYDQTITRTIVIYDDLNHNNSLDDKEPYEKCVFTYVVKADKTKPEIYCPDNKYIDCKGSIHPDDTGYPTGKDNCDDKLTFAYTDYKEEDGCGYKIKRVWKATDDCGNYSECTQYIYVKDTEKPVIYCPEDKYVECDASTHPDHTGYPTGRDNCDDKLDFTYTDYKVDLECGYKIIRTWKAKDDCGNYSEECKQTIYVTDKTAPAIYCPEDKYVECDASTHPDNTGKAWAKDNCDDHPVITYSDYKVDLECGYKIIRTWRAEDKCKNYSECKQTIYVVDKTPPVIYCPKDVWTDCNGSTDPSACQWATAKDNCDPYPKITYSDYKVDLECGYKIIRTWRAEDKCKNYSECKQTIYVVDKTPPVIYCPANITVECNTSTHPDKTGRATAKDNCDPYPVITYSDYKEYLSCGYRIKRTWRAKDKCGNYSTCVQYITVTDRTAPVIYCPKDVTVKWDGSIDPAYTGKATAKDNCDPYPVITYSDYKDPQHCGLKIIRTWKAKDKCGNYSTCKQVITRESVLCTYTQGFYGNPNGLALLPSLLTSPLTVGRTGQSFTIPVNDATTNSAAKLNKMMPGGGTAAVLKVGDCDITTSCVSQYLTSTGKIKNVLLSQTITLTLNTRLKGGILSCFQLKGGYLTTKEGGCVMLNSTVVNYLTANGTKSASVTDLLNLANDVLGGTKTAGVNGVPSLSSINSVVDAINKVFDECKTFTGYSSSCPYTTTTAPTVTTSTQKAEVLPEDNAVALKVSAYPNPFTDKVRFVIESPVSGRGSLDVFNLLGQKVANVYQGQVFSGRSQIIEYNVPPLHRTTLIYRFTVGDHQVSGKLINVK